MEKTSHNLPLLYSCSGCSSAAQMTNDVAVRLDREGHAQMSCIAGLGGDVKPLVMLAMSGRKIVALDGCPLQCARACLSRHRLIPDLHFELSRLGVRKRYQADYDSNQAQGIYETVRKGIAELKLPAAASSNAAAGP